MINKKLSTLCKRSLLNNNNNQILQNENLNRSTSTSNISSNNTNNFSNSLLMEQHNEFIYLLSHYLSILQDLKNNFTTISHLMSIFSNLVYLQNKRNNNCLIN